MMISIRRIQVGEGELFRQLRLASLAESPSAFSSTYEAVESRSAESWTNQADDTASGADRATFFAFSEETPIGIAALYRDIRTPATGELLQVWVAPQYRGKGVSKTLLDAVLGWGRRNGFRRVLASVTEGNARALRFYLSYGFLLAGGTDFETPEHLLYLELDEG